MEKMELLPAIIHTVHRIHALHILSTDNFHELWIKYMKNILISPNIETCRKFQLILFFMSSNVEEKELSDEIISSTLLQALMAVVWSFLSNSVLTRL